MRVVSSSSTGSLKTWFHHGSTLPLTTGDVARWPPHRSVASGSDVIPPPKSSRCMSTARRRQQGHAATVVVTPLVVEQADPCVAAGTHAGRHARTHTHTHTHHCRLPSRSPCGPSPAACAPGRGRPAAGSAACPGTCPPPRSGRGRGCSPTAARAAPRPAPRLRRTTTARGVVSCVTSGSKDRSRLLVAAATQTQNVTASAARASSRRPNSAPSSRSLPMPPLSPRRRYQPRARARSARLDSRTTVRPMKSFAESWSQSSITTYRGRMGGWEEPWYRGVPPCSRASTATVVGQDSRLTRSL